MLTKQTLWTSQDERCVETTWVFNRRCGIMYGNADANIWFNGRACYRGDKPDAWDDAQAVEEEHVMITESVQSV